MFDHIKSLVILNQVVQGHFVFKGSKIPHSVDNRSKYSRVLKNEIHKTKLTEGTSEI